MSIVPFCLRGEFRDCFNPKDLPSLGLCLSGLDQRLLGFGITRLLHGLQQLLPVSSLASSVHFVISVWNAFFLLGFSIPPLSQLVAQGTSAFTFHSQHMKLSQGSPPLWTGAPGSSGLHQVYLQRLLNFHCNRLASEMLMKPASLPSSQHTMQFNADGS